MLKKNWILVSIVAFGLVLRLIFLGQSPAGFAADEAVQGYDAYSLLKTGKDQWGISWPVISFRSFADFKAPIQTYLMLPSIAYFGLNEFATRLPSALVGTLAIISIYLLSFELFKDKRVALLSALLLAISPWHLQFSRTALEANLISLFFPFGLFAFLKAKDSPRWYFVSAASWALSLYSYHSIKIFLPFFLLALFLLFRSDLKKQFKSLVVPGILFLVLLSPLIFSTFFGSAGRRGQELLVTNFSTLQIKDISDTQYFSPLNSVSPKLSKVLINKATYTLDKITENYITYLSPTFWFTEGGRDVSYHVIPGRGLLYLWLFPFVAIGLWHVFGTSKKTTSRLLIFWLFLAPLPSAITKEGYRPNRATAFLAFWEMIAAYGLIIFIDRYSKYFKVIVPAILLVAGVSFVSYANDYLYASPIHYPNTINYGYRQVMEKLKPIENDYEQIIFSKGEENQIFVAFYKQLDPTIYQEYSQEWWKRFVKTDFLYTDMLEDYSLDKYRFKTINRDDLLKPNTLFVIRADKFFDEKYLTPFVIDKVYYPNQDPAFYLLSTK